MRACLFIDVGIIVLSSLNESYFLSWVEVVGRVMTDFRCVVLSLRHLRAATGTYFAVICKEEEVEEIEKKIFSYF